jgi:serine/threonine-protein kinase HipA
MIKLNVWLTTYLGQRLLAGELITSDPDTQGRLQGQFRYSADYLEHSLSFPLDPLHLPLSTSIFDANRPHSGVHGVFEDSLPDDWGRRLLVRRHKLSRNKQRAPHLLQHLGRGLGALTYSPGNKSQSYDNDVESWLLPDLQSQAVKFEQNPTQTTDELTLLLQAGSSPGGARPKALIKDGNTRYIAKFHSFKDEFDVVALEAATMSLASKAGIETATTTIVPCGNRNSLLVERFDTTPHADGRNHMISMQTLLGADGYYNMSYRDMADMIRKISDRPTRDLKRLFSQLVFNITIGNTDDHLKNFCMLYTGDGWTLSPAFDLTPNIGLNMEHVLRIVGNNTAPQRRELIREARYFGIKQAAQAELIIDRIITSVSSWENIFKSFNVPDHDIERLRPDIEKRIGLLTRRGQA